MSITAQLQNTKENKMGANSKIEWCDHTFNPWIGCQKVSTECKYCYAEAMMDHRYGKVEWGPHGERKKTSDANWRNPVKWNNEAGAFKEEHGHRPRVFCASLADVFDNQVPSAWREELFALIRACNKLDWLLLTKRPQNIAKMLPTDWGNGYSNVWLGMSAGNQKYFDERWKYLKKIPAVIKFISHEPALGPLQLPNDGPVPDWVISGGESGGNARPIKRRWVRDVIADCRKHDIAAFFKQWGVYQNNPLVVNKGMTIAEAKALDGFGKGGGMIDGELVREFPVPRNIAKRDAA